MRLCLQRRKFMAAVAGAVAWPLAARAQQPQQMRVIGLLITTSEDDPEWNARLTAFEQELGKMGWIEGRNVRFERRWSPVDPDSIRTHAAELVAMAPEVIVTSS